MNVKHEQDEQELDWINFMDRILIEKYSVIEEKSENSIVLRDLPSELLEWARQVNHCARGFRVYRDCDVLVEFAADRIRAHALGILW